jgi:hypothetical protein
MSKSVLIHSTDGNVVFWCPGCEEYHMVWITTPNTLTGAKWSWNGDDIKPTFNPSILVNGRKRCHSYVRDGKIEYLNDCNHSLAGQTVALIPDTFSS